MEMEFDNEIDALLRKERGARTITISEFASPHLDADEIAAFAESALPEATKQAYFAHFADCEGCRKTLSSVILLNSETDVEPATAVAAPIIAENVVPWYRKLFLFPNLANLAYLMGSVILLFSGFLAISVMRNSGGDSSPDVSQIRADEPTASGPNLDYAAGSYNSNLSANAMNTAANTMANAANSAANSSASSPNPAFASNTSATPADAKNPPPAISADRVETGRDAPTTAAAPQPPPPPKERPVEADDQTTMLGREKRAVLLKDADKQKAESKVMQEQAPAGTGGPFKVQKGPSRNDQRSDSRMRENELASKKTATPAAAAVSNRRQVAGKAFDLRQGVWYESAYRGQTTTNIRRGTGDFRKLDSGLRYIADSFPGTVVIVWKDKAFRID